MTAASPHPASANPPRFEPARELIDDTVKAFGIAFTVNDQVLDPSQVVIHGAAALTEYGQLMSDGGVHVRNRASEVERIYPLAQWIPDHCRHGGKVLRRRVIMVEDWEEVTEP